VESSKIIGRILCGRGPGIDLDPEKLHEGLASRWDFIYTLDMKKHKNKALETFQTLEGGIVIDK